MAPTARVALCSEYQTASSHCPPIPLCLLSAPLHEDCRITFIAQMMRSMAIQNILSYCPRASHALTVSAPWIRVLVETGGAQSDWPDPSDATAVDRTLQLYASFLSSEVVDVSHSDVEDLSALPALESARVVDISFCFAVHDLTPLQQRCAHLQVLRLWKTTVSDLSPVAALPCLREIDASESAVRILAGLASCRQLKKVTFHDCQHLRDLAALAGALSLEEIDASWSAVRTLSGLHTCQRLRKIDVERCQFLHDFHGLEGAVSLEEIDAEGSAVTTLEGLNTCLLLKTVDVQACKSLFDLSPLAGSPRLTRIAASGSAVMVLTGLNTCPKLQIISLGLCERLTDVSALAGAPSLEVIEAWNSCITAVGNLDLCPKLKILDLRGTPFEAHTREVTTPQPR